MTIRIIQINKARDRNYELIQSSVRINRMENSTVLRGIENYAVQHAFLRKSCGLWVLSHFKQFLGILV